MADRDAHDIRSFYEGSDEAGRLGQGAGQLELARTQEILTRALPPPPAVVLDVGGGTGPYARWLAGLGYQVHLVDLVPAHVARAEAEGGLASARVGDARALAEADRSVDAVLLLGPLYHLTARADREQALREARRVVRAGGPVVAAAISRFASALDGLIGDHLADPAFEAIVRRDLTDGQHRNSTGNRAGSRPRTSTAPTSSPTRCAPPAWSTARPWPSRARPG